jgi:mannose-6-phosphate isomerase-like protein (cupin superfamily)
LKENVVIKPWGYEYLAYSNENVGIWILHLNENESTSMHCHTEKTTGLVVLDGSINLSFLADDLVLHKMDKKMIRRGLFHSSKSTSQGGSVLLEIETPNRKNDLVRLDDKYGRKLTPCESGQKSKLTDLIKFTTPKSFCSNAFYSKKCKFVIDNKPSSDVFLSKNDSDLIIFLRGGIISPTKQRVVIPGDIGFGKIVKTVFNKIPILAKDTLILTISHA